MKSAWFLAHSTADPAQLPETGWRQITLPHQWTPDGIEAEVGWYRLEFPEAWVINDLDREPEVRVSLRLEGPVSPALFETEALSAHHIEKQSAQRIFQIDEYYEASSASSPGEDYAQMASALRRLVPGEYRLVGEVFEGGTLLSRNELAVTYLDPIVPMDPGW